MVGFKTHTVKVLQLKCKTLWLLPSSQYFLAGQTPLCQGSCYFQHVAFVLLPCTVSAINTVLTAGLAGGPVIAPAPQSSDRWFCWLWWRPSYLQRLRGCLWRAGSLAMRSCRSLASQSCSPSQGGVGQWMDVQNSPVSNSCSSNCAFLKPLQELLT